MNLFITGSNGYIGSHFIKEVVKDKKIKIFALTTKKRNKQYKNVEWLVGDINKKWNELKSTDVLIHFASEGVKKINENYKNCYDFNVLRSKELVKNAFNAGCKKWIIITTCKEKKIEKMKINNKNYNFYKHLPYVNYALTKKIFSNFCYEFSTKYKVKTRIIRLFQIYGGKEAKKRLVPTLLKKKFSGKVIVSNGNQKQDFCNIHFVIKELIKSLNFNFKMKKFPQIWDFATGKSISVSNFINKINIKIKSKAKVIYSKKKIYDNFNYFADKKKLWKIKNEF